LTSHKIVQVYLIGDLVRPTSSQLKADLETCFNVEVVPPVFIESADLLNTEIVNAERFEAHHLRTPLLGEIGCALAHVDVYQRLIASGVQWAMVFEDDVEVTDATRLKLRAHEITNQLPASEPTIVNLNSRAAIPCRLSRRAPIAGLWWPGVATYTTSCYLINTSAAKRIVGRQTPVSTQSDWPLTSRDVTFLQETIPNALPVRDEISLIDPGGARSNFNVSLRLQIWSGIWYVRKRRYFRNFGDYWHSILKPRIYRHVYQATAK